MITIFNRMELKITYSMKEQMDLREFLTSKNIDYSIKVINRKSPSPFASGSRARSGTIGEKLDLSYEYIFYVKKQDYVHAQSVLREMKH